MDGDTTTVSAPSDPAATTTAAAAALGRPTDLDDDYDTDASSSASSTASSSASESPARAESAASGRRAPSAADAAAAPSGPAEDGGGPAGPSPVCAVRLRRMEHAHRTLGSKAPREDAADDAAAGDVPVTPYLLYQLLRSFGFPKRLLVFGPSASGGESASSSISRGLAQFDSADACAECIRGFAAVGRWVNEEMLVANAEVHLGGADVADVFSVTLSPAREHKVFATTNGPHSLVVTAPVITHLGPPCERGPLHPPAIDAPVAAAPTVAVSTSVAALNAASPPFGPASEASLPVPPSAVHHQARDPSSVPAQHDHHHHRSPPQPPAPYDEYGGYRHGGGGPLPMPPQDPYAMAPGPRHHYHHQHHEHRMDPYTSRAAVHHHHHHQHAHARPPSGGPAYGGDVGYSHHHHHAHRHYADVHAGATAAAPTVSGYYHSGASFPPPHEEVRRGYDSAPPPPPHHHHHGHHNPYHGHHHHHHHGGYHQGTPAGYGGGGGPPQHYHHHHHHRPEDRYVGGEAQAPAPPRSDPRPWHPPAPTPPPEEAPTLSPPQHGSHEPPQASPMPRPVPAPRQQAAMPALPPGYSLAMAPKAGSKKKDSSPGDATGASWATPRR